MLRRLTNRPVNKRGFPACWTVPRWIAIENPRSQLAFAKQRLRQREQHPRKLE
jgi:hypothetical protein